MKFSPVFLAIMLAGSLCFADAPKTKEDFLAAIRTAFESKDPEQIKALTYLQGNSAGANPVGFFYQKVLAENSAKVDSATLEEMPVDFKMERIARGKRSVVSEKPTGVVRITSKEGQDSSGTTIPYAVIDGGYYLIGIKVTDLGWKGPPDKLLNISVTGKGASKLHIKYNTSGVDLEEESDATATAHQFYGQYISEVTLTSTDPNAHLTLKIEGNEKPYTSELIGAATVVYKKPD